VTIRGRSTTADPEYVVKSACQRARIYRPNTGDERDAVSLAWPDSCSGTMHPLVTEDAHTECNRPISRQQLSYKLRPAYQKFRIIFGLCSLSYAYCQESTEVKICWWNLYYECARLAKASVDILNDEWYANSDVSITDLECWKYSLNFNFVQRNDVMDFTD